MRVCVSSETRFRMTPDGGVWTDGPCNHAYLTRMLKAFDHVNVLARVVPVSEVPSNFRRVDDSHISFSALPNYHGPMQYLLRSRRIMRAVRAAIGPHDAVILNAPGQISQCLRSALAPGRPYGVCVLGDPEDVFAPGAIRHPLRPLLHVLLPRQLRELCRQACGALYISNQSLPTRYPCPAHMALASDAELPPEAFVDAPRRAPRDRTGLSSSPSHGGPLTLVHVGTMSQIYKGQDLIIAAVAECLRSGLDLRVVLIGEGKHQPELEERARRQGVADRVEFHGQLPPGDRIRAELDAADLFVFPSRAEALGRALLEAMARGLPCIGARVGGIPELLTDEDLVPPGDASSLAAAIRAALGDESRYRRMSERCLQKSQEYRGESLESRRTEFFRHVADRTAEWSTPDVDFGRHNKTVNETKAVAVAELR